MMYCSCIYTQNRNMSQNITVVKNVNERGLKTTEINVVLYAKTFATKSYVQGQTIIYSLTENIL